MSVIRHFLIEAKYNSLFFNMLIIIFKKLSWDSNEGDWLDVKIKFIIKTNNVKNKKNIEFLFLNSWYWIKKLAIDKNNRCSYILEKR